jgi:hypothetical protein
VTGRLVTGPEWVGVNVLRWYVALIGPSHPPRFSERNRINVFVVPLPRGWRLRVRRRTSGLGEDA